MPEAARGDQTDVVESLTGSGSNCASPLTTSTNECSPDVFALEIGIVRKDDKVNPHPKAGCGTDTSGLTTFSSNVFVNNLNAGRNGDNYTSDNTIVTGAPTVFINGR